MWISNNGPADVFISLKGEGKSGHSESSIPSVRKDRELEPEGGDA